MPPRTDPLDAGALVEVMGRFAEALGAHRDELNSLNVFPVPDGDTGTNMLLTQEAVVRALEDARPASVPEAGVTIARAALMGARGNSGVILSQVLRGFVSGLDGERAEGATLAASLREASAEAERAVARPQPGTMLTVLDEAATGAEGASDGAPGEVARAALRSGSEALQRTPDLLPELRRAGVVDAGGRGIVLFLDALHSVLSGEPLSVEVGPLGPVGREDGEALAAAPLQFSHEVMYLLEAPDDRVPAVRERLAGLGDSLVLVGGSGLYNVHVHTNEVDAAVDAGRAAGTTKDVRVTSLEDQVAEQCLAGQARAVRVAEQRLGLVAVADGDGLADLFRSLGALVVPGGPGRNPSVADLLAAVEATGTDRVILLPNHRNIVPAAERAARGAAAHGVDVAVVATRSIPEGIAAAAACNPLGDPVEVTEDMRAAADACASGEVAVAVRDAETPAGAVRRGDWVATVAGEVRAVGADPASLAAGLVTELLRPDHEVLTLLVGRDPAPAEASRVEAAARAAADGLEVEVHHGGQPHYVYLLGLE